jgi:uncharacterized protein (TIGR02246 family)
MPQDADALSEVRALYERLLNAWNMMSATDFATLFASDGNAIGFDGSQMNGQTAIKTSLAAIFADHEPALYVGIIREVRFISDDVAILRADAGMVRRGETELNDNLTIQSLVATQDGARWKIALWHNTPASFDGRPKAREELFADLREELRGAH